MPRIDTDLKLDFKDVLIRPKRSTIKSRSDVDLIDTFNFRNSKNSHTMIPLMASNMETIGTFEMAKEFAANQLFTCVHKYYSIEEWRQFAQKSRSALPYMAVSAGLDKGNLENLTGILRAVPELKFICIDAANGYSEHFVEFVKEVRMANPNHNIIAGNVVTGEMAEQLLLSGADIVKVGIGPGSVCSTRKKTGVGYPQLSAVIDCADAAHGLDGHIISDGDCTVPGDVAKAFGAGADYVMISGMLAGHDEAGGDLVERNGKKSKIFYGSSSDTAMRRYAGSMPDYRSFGGKPVEVPYRGPVEATIQDILGGVRSTCTYVGATRLKELRKRTTFIRVTQQINDVYSPNTIEM